MLAGRSYAFELNSDQSPDADPDLYRVLDFSSEFRLTLGSQQPGRSCVLIEMINCLCTLVCSSSVDDEQLCM